MRRGVLQALLAASLLALGGYAAAALVAGPGRAAGPVLDASVGPGFTISLMQGGSPVTNLAAGDYTINVSDSATSHSFHLQGPGVDQGTTIAGTGSATWNVTFSDGTYTFFCDMHPTTMRGSFTAGAQTSTSSTTSTMATTTTTTTTTSTTTTTTTSPTTTTATTTVPPTTTSPVSTTTTTTTPTTSTTRPEPTTSTNPTKVVAAMAVQSLRVVAQGRRAARVLLVRVDLSKAGPVRVRLLRRGHALATLRSRIGARPTTLRLHVPASAPAGRYTIEVVAGSGPTAKRVLRSVTLRG